MQIFVGLGNPGAEHAGQRHNVGFMALDRIAGDHGFGPWRSRFKALAAEGVVGGEKVLALKPQTYMNLSGQSVGEAMRFYKLAPDAVTVLYDELDLAPGKVRVKRGGGAAGHNGIRSMDAHIGADFRRVRIGIGHPGQKDRVSGYVLSDFAKADRDWLDAVMAGLSEGVGALVQGDEARFLNAVSLRVAPPRSGGGTQSGSAIPAPTSAPGRTATQAADPTPDAGRPDGPDSPGGLLRRLVERFR
jgi:PTH1 family peptidyl-tRNA hydrolase